MDVVGEKKLPSLDTMKSSTGLLSPKPEENVLLKLAPRL